MYFVNSVLKSTLLLSVLFVGCLKCTNSLSTLKAVSMLTRHGDRAPERVYPLDPYASYEWPGGKGALSPKGTRELYLSGLIKLGRYSSLLTPICLTEPCTFDLNKIYVQSSAVPRCVASATSFLEAFLPIQWPQELIVVLSYSEDEILGYGKPCPNYDYVMNIGSGLESPEFKEIIDFKSREGQDFLNYLMKNTGLNITTSMDILYFVDTLIVQHDNGFKLPEWAESVFDRYLVPLSAATMKIWGETQYLKIRSGALLKNMIDRLEGFINGLNEQSILFYSAHDLNIAGMLALLDIRNQTAGSPAYGAVFAMELYETAEIADDLEIKIIYFTYFGDENPIAISIPNCAAPCPLRKFIETVEPKFTLNYEEACLQ